MRPTSSIIVIGIRIISILLLFSSYIKFEDSTPEEDLHVYLTRPGKVMDGFQNFPLSGKEVFLLRATSREGQGVLNSILASEVINQTIRIIGDRHFSFEDTDPNE